MTAAALLAAAKASGVTLRPRLWADGIDRLPASLRAELKARELDVILALVANDDGEPARPCPLCQGRIFWRASVLSGGPGPWACSRCDPAPADVWQDASAVPGGEQ